MTTDASIEDQAVNAEQLDAAIVEILRATDDQCMPWRHLRKLLPDERFWPRLWSLTRLVEADRVQVWKDDRGRNYVCLSIVLPPPRQTRHRRAS